MSTTTYVRNGFADVVLDAAVRAVVEELGATNAGVVAGRLGIRRQRALTRLNELARQGKIIRGPQRRGPGTDLTFRSHSYEPPVIWL